MRLGFALRSVMFNFLKTVAVTAATFGLFLVSLEITLRTTHLFNARISWSEPDEIYGWRFAPRARYWNRPAEGGRSSGRINSHGWRDVEWSLNKEPGVYRVAVVGDSYVEAFQVELLETFPKLAERTLVSKGFRVETMNFGRSGFTTTEELLVVRDEVLRFSPDLVVLFFYPPNDIRDVSKELARGQLRPFFLSDGSSRLYLDTSFTKSLTFRLKQLINPLKRNSALISLAVERHQMLLEGRAHASFEAECEISGYLTLATSSPDPAYSRAFELNKRLIKEIARIVKGQSEMMLVTIDSFGWKTSDETCIRSKDASFNAFYFDDELRKLARTEKMHHLGLQREFRRDWENNKRELHWGHWNYEGHELVAELLAIKIENILKSSYRSHHSEGSNTELSPGMAFPEAPKRPEH